MKKLAIISFLILVTLTGCATGKNPENLPEANNKNSTPYKIADKTVEYKKISLNEVKDLPDVEIVKKLFTKYLEHYTAQSISDGERLINYKVEKVREVNDNGEIVFLVTYSVHPCKINGFWIAGDGQRTEDGWIIRKGLYVRLIKEEEQFIMGIMGTGL